MKLKKVENQANILMENRRSIRKYDPTVKIPREVMSNILQDAMTAPSAFNLQPWRFVVIDSAEGKELTKPFMAFNQRQHETSSAIIVVYTDLDNVGSVDAILNEDVKHGLREEATINQMSQIIKSYNANSTQESLLRSQVLDCGLVSMQIMLSAKAYGYDTNAIGGFDRDGISKALGMDPERYFPALVISIGKSIENGHDSTRFSVEEVTFWK